MKVSVVIITKNRIESLKKCVESLLKQTVLPYELIVVDGSDNEETKEYIDKLKKFVNFSVFYIKQEHGGTATARNLGANIASGEIVLFVDDDVLLYPDYIEKLICLFKEDKDGTIGCVGGNPICPGHRHNFLSKIFSKIFGIIFLRDSLTPGGVTKAGHHSALPNKTSYVKWLGGSQFACRKTILKEFHWDERLEKYSTYAFYEDFDFTYSVSKKYKLLLSAELKSIHLCSPEGREETSNVNFAKILNHYYLVKKHEFSKIAFWWSKFGLLIAHILILILKPKKENYMALKMLIRGCMHIACKVRKK